LIHAQAEVPPSSATARELLDVGLVSVTFMPSSTPGGAEADAVADAGDGLLEGLGHADLLRVRAGVGAVDAEQQRGQADVDQRAAKCSYAHSGRWW
jgi:hypothetical protein